jgi:hypothetical protein
MQKVTFHCDAGPANKPCGTKTHEYHIVLRSHAGDSGTRFDLCEYHAVQIHAALRGQISLPRDPAEAACP